jgi:anti-sigma regulatory factor (Ser/Thr protein kinase)
MRPLRRIFPGRDSQVALARDFVRRAAGPGCPMLDEATLLTSEPCTNALQHTASGAGGSFEVTVFRQPDALRVEVRDEGADSKPAVRSLADMPEDGRGLEVVHLIADRWGQHGDRFGRTVFFELLWPPPTPGQSPPGDDPAQRPCHGHQDDRRAGARR